MMLFNYATQYANDVLDGKEIANRYVKKQCQLFLDDLERQHDDDFEFYLDLDEVKKVEGILKLMNFATGIGVIGKSVLEGLETAQFQAFFLCNIFGWRFKSNPTKYRYRDVTLFICRKNGKTWLCGLVLIILMLTEIIQ